MMLKAGLWAFAGKGGHQVVNFALVIILARLLTPEAFGIVAAAQVVLVLSQVVVQFGLGAALIQTDRLTRSMERTALTLMLGMALVMAGVIHLATPWLARLMTIPELVEVMPVMLLTFLLSAVTNPGMSLLMRDMRFKLLAAIDVGTFALLHAVIAVGLALAGWSYWAIILATLASTAAKAFIVWYLRPVWPILRMHREEVRGLLGFGSGVFLTQMGFALAQRVDNVVVANAFGAAALGLYSRAFNILDLANSLLGRAFRAVLFAGFSSKRRVGSSSKKAMQPVFLRAHAFAAFLILPISAASIVLAPELVMILLGSQWTQAVPILQVLAIGMYFRLGYKVSQAFNLSEGKVFASAWRSLLYAVLVGVLATSGSRFGLVGVGVGVLMALTIVFTLLTQLSLSVLQMSAIRLFAALSPFAAMGGISGAVAWQLAETMRGAETNGVLVVGVTVVVMAALYLLPLWLLRRLPIIHELLEAARSLRRVMGNRIEEQSN
ncbi:oligosaccharide flippase family protein [Rhodobacteraceae bacterium 2376]|uniref:Oligosaccharide flippase family protein n=1 Tax=Rhabdonatronobacter sediminivivens TaxID=2743469 RepID=A0A7Z0I2V3_9RHOB|nr:oligosaccharide flippase family protein [Rhabdonatronobacter sediminivivens]NYS26567.1 oligosaccharide flippase family protein [Rhabdonatronobacter sediminivivens]